LLERSFTDKERLEEYINLETNGEYDTQREDVRGTLLKAGLIKGGKETNYQSIFTTSVKELRKKLSRQFLKSKSKAFLLGRKALNVSDVKGGEVMKKVEQQQVLGEVVLHGKSFGVSRLEKSKCYPYKTSIVNINT